jgi:mannosyltransferase OCH1-like enzyme
LLAFGSIVGAFLTGIWIMQRFLEIKNMYETGTPQGDVESFSSDTVSPGIKADLDGIVSFKAYMPMNERIPTPPFPKLIHITLRNAFKPSDSTWSRIKTWRDQNPEYKVILYDDWDMRFVIQTYYPHLLSMFDGLGRSVERADVWRYAVMHRFGGVYVDSDVSCIKPIRYWNEVFHSQADDRKSQPNVLVGMEYYAQTSQERAFFAAQVQFCNWAFAAVPNHTLFANVLDKIQTRVQKERANEINLTGRWDMDILKRTGPGIWSDSIGDYLAAYNVTPPQVVHGYPVVGDVGFLEKDGFGFTDHIEDIDKLDAHKVLLLHHFKGSWKSPFNQRQ